MIEISPDRHAVDVAHEEGVLVNGDGVETPTGIKLKHPVPGMLLHPGGRVSKVILGKALSESGEWVGAWLLHSRDEADRYGRLDCEGYIDFAEHEPSFVLEDRIRPDGLEEASDLAGLTFDDEIVCAAPGCHLRGYLKFGAWWHDADATDAGPDAFAILGAAAEGAKVGQPD